MASCQTTQWVSTSPYVKLTVTQSASTDTSVTLSWTLQYIASSAANTNGNSRSYTVKINGSSVKTGTYDIDGKKGTYTVASGTTTVTKGTSAKSVSFSVSFAFNVTWSGTYGGTKSASGSISIAAKTSYTVSYNANGGSGAPSSQTKWHGTALTLSSTKPTRTGYTFQGWATSASGSVAYAAGASYTANAKVTLYAVWKAATYTVSYNANGGSGAPSSQTKTHGTDLTLSSTKPTRTNYTFKGWGTSAGATTVTYAAGAKYTANASITLYAVWVLSYTKPRITSFSITRCDSSGSADSEGTYALVKFNWACDKTVSSIKIEWKKTSDTTWTSSTVTASGTSGSVSQVVGAATLSAESTYDFKVTVSDNSGSTEKKGTLTSAVFEIDALNGGGGVAFGKVAELPGKADFGYDIYSRKTVIVANDKSIFGVDPNGESYSALIPVTASGNTSLGHGLYKAGKGHTHIYGNDVQFYTNEGIFTNGNEIIMDNDVSICGYDSNGVKKRIFSAQSGSGNTVIGYDNYDKQSGNVNIYAYDIVHFVSNIATPGSYRPYRRRGDALPITIKTAGYVTNAGTDVFFIVPFSEPIVGEPTITAVSGNGFIFRQGNKYTHGSTASVYVKPTSYKTTRFMHHGVVICATFSDTTNVTNNDAIGVTWDGIIELG